MTRRHLRRAAQILALLFAAWWVIELVLHPAATILVTIGLTASIAWTASNPRSRRRRR